MPLGYPYASPEDLEGRLGKSDDGTFERLLGAASREVEKFTRRQFNRAGEDDEYAATPRRYRALDHERLAVDDFYSLEGLTVEVAGVFWELDTHFDVRPWKTEAGSVEWPYSDLFAVSRSWPWSRRPNITVSAQWGWAAVPDGIVEATLDVAELMSFGFAGLSGVVRSEAIGGYAVSYAIPEMGKGYDCPREFAKALPYRRSRFGVA